MIWSVAWRNVWRSKTRSIVMVCAIAVGLLAGIFLMAFMNGMYNSRIETATKTELSHIQVHHPHFLEYNENITRALPEDNRIGLEWIKKPNLIRFLVYSHWMLCVDC